MTVPRTENEKARAPTRTTHRKRRTTIALITAACLLAPGCIPDHAPATTTTATDTVPMPPPAVSSIDNTVSVQIALADSFDVLPDGTCAGRSDNIGIRNGAQVQLRGDTVGGSTWATATTRFEQHPPRIYHGKPVIDDDGQYCIVKAVFAPTRPDPTSSYSVKFVGGSWVHNLVHVGRAPYGRLDRPGYGTANTGIQRCPSLLDPPTKDC